MFFQKTSNTECVIVVTISMHDVDKCSESHPESTVAILKIINCIIHFPMV